MTTAPPIAHQVPNPEPAGLPRLPHRSMLADDVYDILRESLVTHRIEPGTRLNLDKLARDLHVSNTPVRQALARLEAEGLVAKEPYKGFTASPLLDARAIAELYDYRLLIEPATAARAARRRSAPAVTDLHELCDENQLSGLMHDAEPAQALGERDIRFHCLIAREAGNNLIAENLRSTLATMSRYTIYHRKGAGEHAWQEHRAISAAIDAADSEAAASAMRTHLNSGLQRITSAVR